MCRVLHPDGTVLDLCIEAAAIKASKSGRPYVQLDFVEGGVATFGPLDYMWAGFKLGLIPQSTLDKFDMHQPYSIWRELPNDPSFLVGKQGTFKIKHVQVKDAVFPTYRLREIGEER